ncbi:MAG: hypothetical protein EBT89_12340 [Opitutaceae bacterium]|nr:hypothetical protein [Opitutaceae bacterium]
MPRQHTPRGLAALKEAVATGFPRDKMYGVWWSGTLERASSAMVKTSGMIAKLMPIATIIAFRCT